MARGRAVGNHRHRQICRVAGRIGHLHVQHRGQSAQALRANAQPVHLVVELHAQLLRRGLRTARNQLLNVDGVHQRLLGQQHRLLCRAANANAQHARRAPARAHRRHGFQNPLHNRIRRVEHGELRLGLAAAALGRNRNLARRAGNQLHVHHRRRVVSCVLARAGWVSQHRGTQRVVGVKIRLAHTGVHHLLQAHRGRAAVIRGKARVHAQLDEGVDDARVLADRPMALGAHAAVDEDLRHRVARRGRLLFLIRLG